MRKWILRKNRKGMTLVEIIVTMVILGIVMLAITSFFLSSNKISIVGSNQRNAQSEARLAVDQILMDIRYAKELTLLSPTLAETEKTTTDYNYIYYKDGSINRSIYDPDTATRKNQVLIGEFSEIKSYFQKTGSATIQIVIGNDEGNQSYTIESTIQLPNLLLTDPVSVIGGDTIALGMKFK